jgi:hypothetical protein
MSEGQEVISVDQEETPESADPWVKIEKQEFSEPSGTVDPAAEVKEEVNQPEKVVDGTAKADPFNFENTKLPHKYRDEVKAHFEPVLKEKEAALESVTQQAAQSQEAVQSVLGIFKEIAQDPSKMASYVAQYGEALGLSPEVINHYRQPQQEKQVEPQNKPVSYQDISQKYDERLLTTQDPREFVGLLNQRDAEMRDSVKNEMMTQVGGLLKAYHDKYIEPDKKVLKDFQTKAEKDAEKATFEATKSTWVSAKTEIIGKYSDFAKYEGEVAKMIQSDPHFELARQHLNQNPNDLEGRKSLIEKAYQLVSMKDRMTAKKPTVSGLPPTSKFLNTKKTGGGGWNDPIHKEIFGED